MTMLMIENDGEMDINGLRLLGATSKEGQEGKIGFFGTGTKYAIASALRLGIEIKIYSGQSEVIIKTKPVHFRGENYDEILINDCQTGITTRTGITWQPWYIIREFLCNAIDEGNHALDLSDTHSGAKGKTRIFIELNKDLRGVYDSWEEYFAFDRHAYHCQGDNKVYLPITPDRATVYRRGVKIWESKQPSILDYDLPNIAINEARVVISEFDAAWNIVHFWKHHATPAMVALLIATKLDRMEFGFDWQYGGEGACDSWLEALKKLTILPKENAGHYLKEMEMPHVVLPTSMCVWLHKSFGEKLFICGIKSERDKTIKTIEPTDRHAALLKDSIAFLKSGGFADADRWPIYIAELEIGVLGCFVNGAIYLAIEVFSMGRRAVAETLLEEYAHAKSKQSDETREFQNVLLRFVIDAIENKTGTYL